MCEKGIADKGRDAKFHGRKRLDYGEGKTEDDHVGEFPKRDVLVG